MKKDHQQSMECSKMLGYNITKRFKDDIVDQNGFTIYCDFAINKTYSIHKLH